MEQNFFHICYHTLNYWEWKFWKIFVWYPSKNSYFLLDDSRKMKLGTSIGIDHFYHFIELFALLEAIISIKIKLEFHWNLILVLQSVLLVVLSIFPLLVRTYLLTSTLTLLTYEFLIDKTPKYNNRLMLLTDSSCMTHIVNKCGFINIDITHLNFDPGDVKYIS